MKRTIMALSLLAAAGAVAAQQSGGFTGPSGVQSATIAEAIKLPDDTQVKVTGYLVRSVGDERYQLKDDTGTLIVEIDDDDWNGVQANPQTRLELTGEMDQDDGRVELDVDRVALAQ